MGESNWACPVPVAAGAGRISLAHGEGGRLMRQMIRDRIVPKLGLDPRMLGDAAVLRDDAAVGDGPVVGERFAVGDAALSADAFVRGRVFGGVAITTDSFVVSPLFFPGGDIGRLAVFGTVNDLAVSGATPRWMTLGLIIEEGLEWEVLDAVLDGVAAAAREANVKVVAGDTKVVPRGAADRLFLNSCGVGVFESEPPPGAGTLVPGDVLIASGPIGCHGVAVMSAREQLGFVPEPRSDCAALTPAVKRLTATGIVPVAMRDATRGGVAAVLHEWAEDCGATLRVDQRQLPINDDVAGVCELLGLDPLHVACEGMMVVGVRAGSADAAIEALRGCDVARHACVIGEVVGKGISPVVVRRGLGRDQPLDEPLGAPMPRIC
jgi:hydrogenase expression/formation protein HypE